MATDVLRLRSRARLSALVFFIAFYGQAEWARAAQAPDASPHNAQNLRITTLAKLWAEVKFKHPQLAYRKVDWDDALLAALRRVRNAGNDADYTSAVAEMLARLADPSTFVEPTATEPDHGVRAEVQHTVSAAPYQQRGRALLISCAGGVQAGGLRRVAEQHSGFTSLLVSAEAIVVDCRTGLSGDSGSSVREIYADYLETLLAWITEGTLPTATFRYRVHRGYASQMPSGSTVYYSAVEELAPREFEGLAEAGNGAKHVAIIVDYLPPKTMLTVAGLRSAGRIRIVEQRQGPGLESWNVTEPMPLTSHRRAFVRTKEVINPDGTTGFSPDAIVAPVDAEETNATPEDATVTRAVALARSDSVQASPPSFAPRTLIPNLDDSHFYAKQIDYPLRMLALFRLWTVIDTFYPYQDLLPAPWEDVLTRFIPIFEAAESRFEYEKAILMLAATIPDSHVTVGNLRAFNQSLGGLSVPPIAMRMMDGKAVVVEVQDRTAGVSIGDVIESIDDIAIADRLLNLRPFVAESSPQAATRTSSRLMWYALAGKYDSDVALTVRSGTSKLRRIVLRRTSSFGELVKRDTAPFRMLASDVGYVNLMRLSLVDLDNVVRQQFNTATIVVDIRGYPGEAGFAFANRVASIDKPAVSSTLEWPLISAAGEAESVHFAYPVKPAKEPRYRGQLIVLINEDTISQGEQICLQLLAGSSRVSLLGTPSSGTDGNITHMILPGYYSVSFTGLAVTFPSGGKIQAVGLQPNIVVKPTLKGVQMERDEQLEAAMAYAARSAAIGK